MSSELYRLVGGHVALDFANTVDDRYVADKTVDLMSTYADLLRFGQQEGLISEAQAGNLQKLDSADQTAALRSARELREGIERAFSAIASGGKAAAGDLQLIEENTRSAAEHRKLTVCREHYQWAWHCPERYARSPLWPIALASADLLVSEDLQFVRECQASTCRWLFLDLSKSHSRRWCDMKTCGNRSKARHYYRKRVGTH